MVQRCSGVRRREHPKRRGGDGVGRGRERMRGFVGFLLWQMVLGKVVYDSLYL